MMEDGLFDRFPCDAIFAMHKLPGLPQGQLVFRDGAAMASSDYASITLTGSVAMARCRTRPPTPSSPRPAS